MTHGCHAERKNGSAASELRCRCAWLHHGSGFLTHRIQGCGAIGPRPESGLPSDRQRGQARAERVARLVRRPTLTAPGRAGLSEARVGAKKTDRTKKLTKEKDALPCRNALTTGAPYKGHPPVLTSPNPLSTLLQRFACARLSRPCLPKSRPGVSATLTTTAFDRSSLRWLEIST